MIYKTKIEKLLDIFGKNFLAKRILRKYKAKEW